METYGVSFDGFEPSCGWPLYRHVENEHLPYLKAEVDGGESTLKHSSRKVTQPVG